jgi:preprotein translocase subunit SecY
MEKGERPTIPQSLRITYLIYFVIALIFGLAGTFAAKFVGDLAEHPVRDADVNGLLGVASLTFALGAWYAYRAARWEEVSLVTAMLAFFTGVGGIGGLIAYFFPSLIGIDRLPPVQLLVSIILLLLGIAFTYFYTSIQGWHAPLGTK